MSLIGKKPPQTTIVDALSRTATNIEIEPSNYMQTLTRYLSNIMNTVLLGLPTEIKELIYFDALSHAATMILVSCTRVREPYWLTECSSHSHYHQKSKVSVQTG